MFTSGLLCRPIDRHDFIGSVQMRSTRTSFSRSIYSPPIIPNRVSKGKVHSKEFPSCLFFDSRVILV